MNRLKVLRYIINIVATVLIIYVISALFGLTDVPCEEIKRAISRGFNFQIELFSILFTFITVINFLLERKIENKGFIKRVLKLSLFHILLFAITFIVNVYILYNRVC